MVAFRLFIGLLSGCLLFGCSPNEQHALLIRVKARGGDSFIPIQSLRARLIDPGTLVTFDDSLEHPVVQSDGEGRVAVEVAEPTTLMVFLTARGIDDAPYSALRCYHVEGLVEDRVLVFGADARPSDGDGDGFSRSDSREGCQDFADDEVVACRNACPESIALDCADESASVFPGAPEPTEQCGNGIDENCDGADVCLDADGDGFASCPADPEAGSPCDCNDADPQVHPNGREVCDDGVDQDCDPTNDTVCDRDGDGVVADRARGGRPDCDDEDPAIHPGAEEVCTPDGAMRRDENCNGQFDELARCVADDQDGDGFADCSVASSPGACDCNDCHPGVHPAATEQCGSGVREDCAGIPDAACAPGDEDGDGFVAMLAGGADCDDDNPLIFPGAPDRCDDAVAGDCGEPTSCVDDTDGDGWIEPPHCADDPTVHPGIADGCSGRDDDCDGNVDEDLRVAEGQACVRDQDGFRAISLNGNDFLNCGGCRLACSVATADRCASGQCDCASESGTGACTSGTTCCPDSGCSHLLSDPLNCGSCGQRCNDQPAHPRANECVNGQCACNGASPCRDVGSGSPLDCCGAQGCVDVSTSLAHCGGCNRGCSPENAVARCFEGVCGFDQCTPGFGSCNSGGQSDADGCETRLNTLANCGACGRRCDRANAVTTCSTGVCEVIGCQAGWGDCNGVASDGCEQPLDTLLNCGQCGTRCERNHATTSCSSSTCTITTCDAGWRDCNGNPVDGCETALGTTNNCGGCGDACGLANASTSCQGQSCRIDACQSPWMNCNGVESDGCETDTTVALAHCGACGALCQLPNATSQCVGGNCAVASCNLGWQDCDGAAANGCETPVGNDVNNCGACGRTCGPGESCTDGVCRCGSTSCVGSDVCCSGRCVDLQSSETDCGECGTMCMGSRMCCSGECVNTQSDADNCGDCGNSCGFGQYCNSGGCAYIPNS